MSILTSTHVGKTKYTVFFQNFDDFIEKILCNIAYHGPGYYKHLYKFDIKNTSTGDISNDGFIIDTKISEEYFSALTLYVYRLDKNDENPFVTEIKNKIKNNIISTLKKYFQSHNDLPCDCMVKDTVKVWLPEKGEKNERKKQSNYLVVI